MSLPEKQELFNEIETLPQAYYEEVLDFLQFLKQKDSTTQNSGKELNSKTLFVIEPKQRHLLMELQGLGKDLWQTIDTESFLEEERNAWD